MSADPTALDTSRARTLTRALDHDSVQVSGRLRSLTGLSLWAELPAAQLGELCWVARADGSQLPAEVVGFDTHAVRLLPLAELGPLQLDAAVRASGQPLHVPVGDALLGRVIDALGQPLDGRPLPADARHDPRAARIPAALSRPTIDRRLTTGIRAIDAAVPLGVGQRVGLFSAAGVGKTQLLAQLARQCDCDRFVLCLTGERSRELGELLQRGLGPAGMARGVVVFEPSGATPLARMGCAYTATAVAEGFRDAGHRVLLLMDSLTRFARAAREVGLAAGEAPARRGFPPSVFARLPQLLERAGTAPRGSITALYTVLVEGDDLDEPIADEVRGLLDGHVVLSRQLAQRGHYPAIDLVTSLSRLLPVLAEAEQRSAAEQLRQHLARYEDKRELITLGAYEAGNDPALDDTLARIDDMYAFLRQPQDEASDLRDTLRALRGLLQ